MMIHHDPDLNSIHHFVEVDPTGRYGRYNEVLGKGASKTVFRAFDEYNGIEVAWNQVKPYDFLRSSQDLERLYSEIHLLKTLKHKNIMKIYASWVDTSTRNINFITELFTSGTLRQYILRHRKVNIRAVKHWCRQILTGLHYLHSHDPPVIHRDLKCDNIFINGNHGEVKIGDLGLAVFLRKSYTDTCVGTPEFMAPEVYNEEYNELVDIYSFGMCVLEMVTLEFPYSECTTPAQIYKKVVSGKKPDAFYKVEDPEVRSFVEKCLATASLRLSARDLLDDPFLSIVGHQLNSVLVECQNGFDGISVIPRHPLGDNHITVGYPCFNGNHVRLVSEGENVEFLPTEIELFEHEEDEDMHIGDISIKGQRSEDGGIFLRLRIADGPDRIRNVYFSFDTEEDTAVSVANEMVSELDLFDLDEINIAEMIDREIAKLIPGWRLGESMGDKPCFTNVGDSLNCISNYPSNNNLRSLSHKRTVSNCTMATHGRFEEIFFEFENGSEQEVIDDAPSVEFSSSGPRENNSDDERGDLNPSNLMVDTGEISTENTSVVETMVNFDSFKRSPSSTQKNDEERRNGMLPTSCVYDKETYKVDVPSVEFSSSGPRENHSDDEHEDSNPSNLMVDAEDISGGNTTVLDTVVNFDSSKPSPSSTQKNDEERSNRMLPTSFVYDNETCKVDGQPRKRQSFPKVGSFKTQCYEQTGVTGKQLSATLSFSCIPRTSSVQEDDSDTWKLYYDFLHTSF